MKKLLLFTGIIIVIIACSFRISNNKHMSLSQQTVLDTPAIKYETLNGIKKQTALDMIAAFKSADTGKIKLMKLNFWFGIDVVNDIVTLLTHEKAVNSKVDGLRIYFACDPKNTSNVSILLVATTDYGPQNKMELHQDYYLHSASEKLFTDTGIAGNVYKEGESTGAKLYKVSGDTNGDHTCDFTKHPHYIKRADAENMVINFGQNNVNTVSEWFPLSVFEDIVNDQKCDGMRIYFATHPDTDIIKEYRKRDAFVIITTQKDTADSTNHNDYFDCVSFQNLNKPGIGISYNNIAGQDNGSLCPNNCNP